MDEAQAQDVVQLRPSYVQRYCGPGSPQRSIVGVGKLGPIGRWVLLDCGHWREIRDWDILPVRGRKRPEAARCGCCRLGYQPDARDVETAQRLQKPA